MIIKNKVSTVACKQDISKNATTEQFKSIQRIVDIINTFMPVIKGTRRGPEVSDLTKSLISTIKNPNSTHEEINQKIVQLADWTADFYQANKRLIESVLIVQDEAQNHIDLKLSNIRKSQTIGGK